MALEDRDESKARLAALKDSLDAEERKRRDKSAYVNDAFLLHTSPQALSAAGATALALAATIVFALLAVGLRNAWFIIPSALSGLCFVGALIAAIKRSR